MADHNAELRGAKAKRACSGARLQYECRQSRLGAAPLAAAVATASGCVRPVPPDDLEKQRRWCAENDDSGERPGMQTISYLQRVPGEFNDVALRPQTCESVAVASGTPRGYLCAGLEAGDAVDQLGKVGVDIPGGEYRNG